MSDFKQIAIIGYGVITGRVLSYVNECANRYGYIVRYIEHEVYPFNAAKKYAKTMGLGSETIEDSNRLTDYFFELAKEGKTLIVSASNNYLFPKQLVENSNIKIINFHNALLPELPGRNAPSWAIYEKYKRTGITWHYVNSKIDEGDIIIQKECVIDNDVKAYELAARLMNIGGDAFETIFEAVLNNAAKVYKQQISQKRKLYKAREIPGGGQFSLEDNALDIYRLLRAMDYGKNNIFPSPETVYKGQKVKVRRYKKMSRREIGNFEDKLFLPIDNEYVLMIKIMADS